MDSNLPGYSFPVSVEKMKAKDLVRVSEYSTVLSFVNDNMLLCRRCFPLRVEGSIPSPPKG